MIQFDKKLIRNLDMNSTKIHCKMVKNYKKKYKFLSQLQHDLNINIGGCYLINILNFYIIMHHFIILF